MKSKVGAAPEPSNQRREQKEKPGMLPLDNNDIFSREGDRVKDTSRTAEEEKETRSRSGSDFKSLPSTPVKNLENKKKG